MITDASRRPEFGGFREVLHASHTAHVCPIHVHRDGTALLITGGAVRYVLDRQPHIASQESVTVLPPDITHDGRPVACRDGATDGAQR